jgi:anti-sigma regulatory factor (Ser/Thr protein kinase)
MAADPELTVRIESEDDMVAARAASRELAAELGFSRTDGTLVATAISELARNIVFHAGDGEIELSPVYEPRRYGLSVVARDSGPGIRDVDSAMRDGYSTCGSLGIGLPGARRLMDEFEIESEPGRGTTVTMKKWRERDDLERLRERRNGNG